MDFTVPVFWRVVRTAPRDRDPGAIARAIGVLETNLRIAETQLARAGFLGQGEFSLADVQFGHVLFRYFDIPIARGEFPALRRYYDRLTGRPAFREHVMVSYEELRVE